MTKIKTGPSTQDVAGEGAAERLTIGADVATAPTSIDVAADALAFDGQGPHLIEGVAATKPYLTTRASETHGGRGSWHDLTDAEFEAAPEGLLKTPTADQLALRRV